MLPSRPRIGPRREPRYVRVTSTSGSPNADRPAWSRISGAKMSPFSKNDLLGEGSLAQVDARRFVGSDLSVHLRDDRPESGSSISAGQGQSRLRRAGAGTQDQHRADP